MVAGDHGKSGFCSIIKSSHESDAKAEPPIGSRRQRPQPRGTQRIEDELAAFGSSIRKTELAKVDLEKQFEERHPSNLMRGRKAHCTAHAQAQALENEGKERADMERLKASKQ